MAGGNLGDLWFQLGIRQNVSQQLDKVMSSLNLTDKEANALLHTLQGLGNKELGISKQSAKDAGTFADVLNKINKRYVELSRNEKTQDKAKALLENTKNALSYLGALQRIAGAQHSLENLKSLNPNVDTSKLKEASGWLEALKKQMLNLQSYGGVDNAKVIGFYSQAVSATLRDVAKVTSSFKKENPLSVLSGNTAKVETDLSRVTEKFARLNDLMAEGARKGYNTSMLTSSFAELNSVLARLQSAQGNNSLLSDAAQMKNLFSDVQVAVNKAGDAMSAYGREKGKVIAAEREHQAELSKAEKKANEKASADRKLTLGLAEMEAWLKRINALSAKGIKLGADTSKMDEMRSKVQGLITTFSQFSGTNAGLLGVDGNPSIEKLINDLRKLSKEYGTAREAQRELNSEQNKANKKTDRDKKDSERKYEQEAVNAARLRDILADIQKYQLRLAGASAGNDASQTASAAAKLQELINLYRQLELIQRHGAKYGENWVGKELQKTNFSTIAKEFNDMCAALERLHTVKGFSFSPATDFDSSAKEKLRAYREEILRLVDDLRSLKKGGHTSDIRDAKENIADLKRKLAQLNVDKNFSKASMFEFKVIQKRLASEERHLARLESFSNSEIPKLEQRLHEVWNKANAIKQTLGSPIKDQGVLNSIASQEYAAKKAAQEEVRVQEQVGNAIDAVKKRYRELTEVFYQMKTERKAMSKLGLDTSEIDAAIARAVNGIKKLRGVLHGLQNSKETFTSRATLGNGSGIAGASDRNIQNYKELNRAKQEAIDKERKHQQEVAVTAAKVRNDLAQAFRQANQHAGQMNSTLRDLKNLFLQGGLVYGAQQFAMSIIQTGGEMERQHIALQSILGDVQNANTMFGQIKQLALESPFTFSELNKDVKQLAAYGVEYENLYDTTKRLADMASGLGVSFERIALAFGQVQARGWLDGKELRQISYAGIPLLSKLSEMYSKNEGRTVSTSEIKKRISNREVSFDDVKQIFWDMTDVGGQFYNMQEVLAQTLLGRWLKLKDAWEIMLSDFASGKSVFGGTMSFMIDRVTDLVQAMHTLAPVVAAAFSGFAVKKMATYLGAGVGATFLASKGKLADSYTSKIAAGKKLTGIEKQILATRGQITASDLKTLAASRAINKTELQRLLVSGKISAAQYKQTLAIIQQQAAVGGLNAKTVQYGFSWARVGAAISLVGVKLKGVFSGLWGMIGGLPGLIMTAATMAIGYIYTQYSNLSEAIDRTQEELADREKQINDFRNTNDVGAAVRSGNEKEIDNMIESYKEKIKELAPYDYNLLVMHAEEKSSHAERLKYLEHELALMQKAYEVSQKTLKGRDNYDSLQSLFESASKNLQNNYMPALDKYETYKYDHNRSRALNQATLNDLKREVEETQGWFEDRTKEVAEKLKDIYGKKWIAGLNSGNQKVKDAAEERFFAVKQTIDSMISGLEISETAGNNLRLSILKGLGLEDDYLKDEVSTRLKEAVEKSAPEVADKIRMRDELDDASKAKVRQLLQGCIDETSQKYPLYKQNLQNLLDSSNFKAVIRLLFVKEGAYGEVEKQLRQNLMSGGYSLANTDKFAGDLKGITSYYDAETKSRSVIDAKYNTYATAKKMHDKGKITDAAFNAVKADYDTYVGMFKAAYGYDYEGTGKKGNKEPKSKADHEDKELKMWQERIQAAKTYYQEYKKYKDVLGPGKAFEQVKDLYPDAVADMDVNDYTGSFQKILDKLDGAWSAKSSERRKFLTTIKKEIKEWNLEEVFKKEAELASAAFNEALEQGISQFDLYKSLLEKTGSKDFASQAFKDGAVWNDLSKGLAQQFKEMTGEDVDLDASDEQAKHHLENIKGAYDLWKKIVDLVKDDYKKSLEESAEVWSKYATIAEKLASINDKYNRIVAEARQRNDASSAETIRRAERGRRNETTDVIYNGFEELKPITEQLNDIADKYAELIRYAKKVGDSSLLGKAEGAKAAAVNDALWRDFNKQTGIEGSVANIESIGYAAAKALSDAIEEWLGKQDLSSELADKLVGFQQKVKNYEYGRGNIFAGMRGLSQGNAISRYLNGGLGDMTTRVDASGVTRYILNSEQAKKTGLTEGGAGYTQGELEDAVEEGKNAFNTSLSSLVDKFKALQDCLSPVIDLFDALGMEDTALGVATNTTSNALGAASSVASGLSSMGLSSMGPYGAAAAAALSITSSLLAMHDKALQKEIDASKEREEVEKNLYDNIKSTLDSLLGGVYTFKLNDSMKSALNSVVSGYESGKEDWRTKLLRAITGDVNANVSYYSDDTYEHSKAALADTNNAYIGQLAALEAQRDELQHQRDLEADKKKSDSSALIQYDQQIVEAEQAVRDFADEFAEAIYGIDLKDWASQLTDAVIEAWAAGEDAIDAYGDKAKELIKSLTSSIVSQMVLEPALKKVQDYYTKKLEETGKLTKEDIPAIGDMIMDTVETSSDQIQSILDYLKEQGYDLSENGSSSTSKSIKSITEETADLLASYINAIRLDCSVTRTNVQAILESVKALPNISAIAQSQLTQLNQLVSLASSRNDKLDTMYDWMQKVTNGTKKLYVA